MEIVEARFAELSEDDEDEAVTLEAIQRAREIVAEFFKRGNRPAIGSTRSGGVSLGWRGVYIDISPDGREISITDVTDLASQLHVLDYDEILERVKRNAREILLSRLSILTEDFRQNCHSLADLKEGIPDHIRSDWQQALVDEELESWFNETCRLLLELPHERWSEIPGYIGRDEKKLP